MHIEKTVIRITNQIPMYYKQFKLLFDAMLTEFPDYE